MNKRTMVSDLVDPFQLDLVGDFDVQVNNILLSVRLTRQEVDNLRTLFIDLERSLQNAWQGCKVMPFGSIVTGLGITSSDVDVYVYVPDNYDYDQVRFVLTARKVLRQRWMLYHNPFAITNAKVPIVKFYHIPTRRNCDVSFKSPSSVRNSQLIAYLLHRDKRALPFTILIKYWAKVHKLTGTNLVTNYALTLLAIFYLQQQNILPTIARLQSPNNSFYVDNWNTAFNERFMYKTNNDQNLYELLGEFFKFYNSFNFEENIISLFIGTTIPRELFKNVEDVPNEFELYKKHCVKGCTPLKIDTIICVQDPFEHNRNCTAAIYPRLAQRLTLHVELAAKIYEENKRNDFLRDILTKKPFIPQQAKKIRKNKNVCQNGEASNSTERSTEGENDKEFNIPEVYNNLDIAKQKETTQDRAEAATNVETMNTPVPSTVNKPRKRTLHNSLTALYRQTKRRKT